MMTEQALTDLVQSRLKDARVHVRDMTGGRDHFEIQVISPDFQDLNLVARHRKMHEILAGPMQGEVHAVKFLTLTPEEFEKRSSKRA